MAPPERAGTTGHPHQPPASRAAPYDRKVEGYGQICYSSAAQRLINCVPATEPGWDSRSRHGEEVLVETGQILPDG